MSDVAVAELATRIRLSDPKPSHCAGCWCGSGPDVRFVDFDGVQLNRGAFVDADGAHGVLDSIDELHLCESCVRQAAEILDVRPGLHRRQINEIRRLLAEAAAKDAYIESLEQALNAKPA